MNERELIMAKSHRRAPRWRERTVQLAGRLYRPCACGVWIGSGTDDDLREIVTRHNGSPQHESWRHRAH